MTMMTEPAKQHNPINWAALVASIFTPRPVAVLPKPSAARSQPYDEVAQAPERNDK